MKIKQLLLCGLAAVSISAFASGNTHHGPGEEKRLLYINSYHRGYNWSDIIEDTAREYFKKNYPAGEIKIKNVYMDAKHNSSEEFQKKAGWNIKQLIESWKPDIIIGSDDNPSKYVYAPYFLNSSIPFVFCGVNEDPKAYGFIDAPNVTGICEIDLVEPLYNHLKKYARGSRVGYMTADKETQRVMAEVNEKQIGKKFDKIYYVKNFEEWKGKFLIIQDQVDMLFMQDVCIVPGWDNQEARKFTRAHIKIPNGATAELMQDYVLICISKSAQEHGLWAAEAAAKILAGTKPDKIPIVINKQGYLSLNLPLANKLNIIFSPSMLRAARTIIDDENSATN
jgi:ABC-type uncharacterized transport system substrate-binding protein